MSQQPLVVQGLLIEDLWSRLDTLHSVEILWTSDQADTETSTWQYTKLAKDRNVCPGGIRTHNLSMRAAAGPSLRPRGHWDQKTDFNIVYLYAFVVTIILYTTEKYLQKKTKRNRSQVYEIRSGYVGLCTVNLFLGAFSKLRKATITFVMSVRPSAWNKSDPNKWISWNLIFQYFS